MENFLCSFKSFAKLNWYISHFCTGGSDSPLYYCVREEGTVFLICCTSDVVEGVPGAEDDQIYIGIEAYSAL